MRLRFTLAVIVAGLAVAMLAGERQQRAAAAGTVTIVVTSAEDSGEAACPSDHSCTLRGAIETANADASGKPVLITLSPQVFPFDHGATVALASPLPALARADAAIDGSTGGMHIDGGGIAGDGIVVSGNASVVRGVSVHNFGGACIVLAGDKAEAIGNRAGGCTTGIAVRGAQAAARGNAIGFEALDDTAAPVSAGIEVSAGQVTVGDMDANAGGNTIGFAQTGVRVGTGGADAFGGTVVTRNTIGRGPLGGPAPVVTAIELGQPGSGSLVARNTIAYARTGIAAAADVDGISVTGNSFVANTFEALLGLAIDLNADGIMNPNGEGPSPGPNGMRNHPVINRAVQSRVTGTAGADCAGCSVQLYLASHAPGGARDYGTVPVAGGAAIADEDGNFAFDNPAVTPGQWLAAIATDAGGNTSEFGPSARVGTGVAQCGNVSLVPGWNHAGYFGADPLVLGSSFPDVGGESRVRAIYHYEKETGTFTHWIAGTPASRTLFTLEPGEPYWFLADETVALGSGFSLTVPLPVQLVAGWNDFVYIGASADVRDALTSIGGKFEAVYRWSNSGAQGSWQKFGDGSEPGWARDFSTMEMCGAYQVLVSEAALLTPLQP